MTPADGEKVLEARALTVQWLDQDAGGRLFDGATHQHKRHHGQVVLAVRGERGGGIMRSKAPLALMEQLVMVLVFALAAALCVQVFVLSSRTSRWNESRDRAVVEAQNAAELLKGDGR